MIRPPPEVPCASCGTPAPRIMQASGLDLHECCCGAYSARWHCCGIVRIAVPATAEYRGGAICPTCGISRFAEQVSPTPEMDAAERREKEEENES